MSAWIIVNAIAMVLCWKWATYDFEHGNNTMGWLNVFFSAWNAAAIANQIF